MKRVLIVRLDAIGDYVLWRNCLRFLRSSARFRDSHLTILGNPAWRSIAETFDRDCADSWIWAEKRNDLFRKGRENLLPYCVWHRRVASAQGRLKAQLAAGNFDEVISPCAFPDSLLDELVLGVAPETVSVSNGDEGRAGRFTWLVDGGNEKFVFLRNKSIASALAGEPCNVPFEFVLGAPAPRTNRIMFFTGASHWTRRWPRRRWNELARMLPPGYEAVEAPQSGSLADFVQFAASCAAVVSNDTMALHVAAALGVPAVGIVNGVSGRDSFWPYPSMMGRQVTVCEPACVPRIAIPLLGARVSQYLALSSISAQTVAVELASLLSS